MNNTSRFVAVLSGLLVAACSGSTASVGDGSPADPPPAAPPSAPNAPVPPPPSVPPAPPADAGTDAPVTPPIALHCNVSSATPDVCLENAQGRAGDVVDVAVVLLGDATCGVANEAGGHLQLDLAHFSVTNQGEQVACRTRTVAQGVSGAQELQWNAFGDGVLPGCQDIPIGTVDTLKIQIAPGTPAGDYKLVWSDADFIGQVSGPAQCSNVTGGVGGTLRVLP